MPKTKKQQQLQIIFQNNRRNFYTKSTHDSVKTSRQNSTKNSIASNNENQQQKNARSKKAKTKAASKLRTKQQPAIKRPRNAFIIFSSEVRGKITRQYPDDSVGQISSRIGCIWSQMELSAKNEYFRRAKSEEIAHRTKYPEYVYKPKMAIQRQMESDQRMMEAVSGLKEQNNFGDQNHQVSFDSAPNFIISGELVDERPANNGRKKGQNIAPGNHCAMGLNGGKTNNRAAVVWEQDDCPLCLHKTYTKRSSSSSSWRNLKQATANFQEQQQYQQNDCYIGLNTLQNHMVNKCHCTECFLAQYHNGTSYYAYDCYDYEESQIWDNWNW